MVIAQVIGQTGHILPSVQVIQSGIGLGTVIAVVCSWERNRSIIWAILAGIFSWFYVAYFALTRTPDEMKKR